MGPTAEQIAERRSGYQAELAKGLDRFFEPRRTTCPWCESPRLTRRLRTPDVVQSKPGTFTVDQCGECSHSFQNPRLNVDGLDFYYQDFYDGLGEGEAGGCFGSGPNRDRYRTSARALARVARPQRWLDVGTGHGHFPQVAKEVLPQTSFDGLDMTDGVERAAAEGRIDEGHRGLFPELAPGMAGRYDAVSMFHYLEHSTEPRAELAAARTVLRPGGHLMIEVPNPESGFSKLLGKWWIPYMQPQHLHLIPAANLCRELEGLGYTVVAAERKEAHMPVDLMMSLLLFLQHHVPGADRAWGPRPNRLVRRFRKALFALALPFLMGLFALDRLLAPLVRRTGFANAYRVIARRE
ncbi:class I SAM-dependent methyltransferase [Streptomyces monticola]|uniref:Class I SAM-dependent methyltransferase n=1 Tax=Streptomyces monticola TaxID=2666263 RepID=A0ABW2JST7_9ACTN